MANRKEIPPEPEMCAPAWVVSFSDLISLMVTFFVLLFTFSDMKKDEFRRVIGSLRGALGVVSEPGKKSKAAISQPKPPLSAKTAGEGLDEHPLRPADEAEPLGASLEEGGYDVPVDLAAMGNGLRIRFEADDLFLPGSTRLQRKAEDLVREVGRFFLGTPVRLVVEAHADSLFHQHTTFANARAYSQAMGLAVARILAGEEGWDPTQIGVAALGDSRPVAADDTPEGRRRNRRIEIQVLPIQGSQP